MEQLKFSIKINSPKAKVWHVMLNDETYRIWSEIFHPGSYYKGRWDEGSRIDFLGPTENGEMGMITRIKANRKEEHISIEFLGMYINGEEDYSSPEALAWKGGTENYTFIEENGFTELIILTEATEQFVDEFKNNWPKALNKIKELCEG